MAIASSIATLVIAAMIGYLAQTTGICMVRGVSDWMRGRRLRLLVIFSSGFRVYVYMPFSEAAALEPARLMDALHYGIDRPMD